MAVSVARVHLKVAHAALPALLPTPPKWNMLPHLPPMPCVIAAVAPKPLAKPGRADIDERWDAHKTKPAGAEPTPYNVRSSAGHRSPPPKPGRADSVERWDAHKTAAPSSSPATSSLANSSKWAISRASSAGRWNVHKQRCPPQTEPVDDGESSGTGSDDIDTEEEILWKPRAMYAGPGFVAAAPESRMLPMPTGFLVRVA